LAHCSNGIQKSALGSFYDGLISPIETELNEMKREAQLLTGLNSDLMEIRSLGIRRIVSRTPIYLESKTDADGRFSFKRRPSGTCYIAASSSRDVAGKTETYEWFVAANPSDSTVILSNDNQINVDFSENPFGTIIKPLQSSHILSSATSEKTKNRVEVLKLRFPTISNLNTQKIRKAVSEKKELLVTQEATRLQKEKQAMLAAKREAAKSLKALENERIALAKLLAQRATNRENDKGKKFSEIQLNDGTKLIGVEISNFLGDSISFMSDAGIKTVAFANLPQDFSDQYLDPEEQRSVTQKLTERRMIVQKAAKMAINVSGTVSHVNTIKSNGLVGSVISGKFIYEHITDEVGKSVQFKVYPTNSEVEFEDNTYDVWVLSPDQVLGFK